jgi:3',5'-cyclic AMP phosphodiesterase CpdA
MRHRHQYLTTSILFAIILIGLTIITQPVRAEGEPQAQPALLRYPYLQQLNPTSVMLVWTTAEPGPSELRYSPDLSFSQVVSATSTFKSVAAPAPYDQYYEHVARLDNLTPGTTYHYALYTQGARLIPATPLQFQTPPVDACTFEVAILGDTGNNSQKARDVRDQAQARSFDFAINLGDLAYNDGAFGELEERYFNMYRTILSEKMIWPTLGNHETSTDNGAPYLDVFHLPEQALAPAEHERYYSFDYGTAHFVVLDTESSLLRISDSTLDDMADWLEADLAATGRFWKIVVMHRPWYVSVDRQHRPAIYNHLIPRFEAYGVDLVLTAHDHLYERTYPIKADQRSTVLDGGVVYITNGEGGGQGRAGYDFVEPPPDWSAFRSKHSDPEGFLYEASYTHLYIDNGLLKLMTIDDQGNVLDPAGGDEPLLLIDRSQDLGDLCDDEPVNRPIFLPVLLK